MRRCPIHRRVFDSKDNTWRRCHAITMRAKRCRLRILHRGHHRGDGVVFSGTLAPRGYGWREWARWLPYSVVAWLWGRI